MSAERGRAATQNRVQNFQMEPAEPLLAALEEALSNCADDIATSIGGRGIYCAPEGPVREANIGRASRGLAVALRCRCDTWI